MAPALGSLACGNLLGVDEYGERGQGGAPSSSKASSSSSSGGAAQSSTAAAGGAMASSSTGAMPKTDGMSCTDGGECASKFCVNSVCCKTACADPCQRCDQGNMSGTCQLLPAQSEPEKSCAGYKCNGKSSMCPTTCEGNGDCTLQYYCDTDLLPHQCVKRQPKGAACVKFGAASCATFFCVDGVCCDMPCMGLCMGCSKMRTGGADGSCLPTSKGVVDPNCLNASKTCDGTGKCDLM